MRRYALCVGINNYPGVGNDLSECVNDVNDWEQTLSDRGWLVKRLTDGLATRENVLANVKYLLNKANPSDSVLIQFSGHGTQLPDINGDEDDGMDEAICVYDGLVMDDEIWEIMRTYKKPGTALVFVSDSCHSGSMVRGVATFSTAGRKRFTPALAFLAAVGKPNWSRPLIPRAANEDSRRVWPCLLLAGCMDNEYSYDAPELKNGAFTYYALSALQRLKPGSLYRDWYAEVRKRLPNSRYPQTPTMTGSYQGREVLS